MGTLSHSTVKTSARTVAAACMLTAVTSAHGLLTTASQNSDGGYSYNVATVPLLAEVLKLGCSLFLLQRETISSRRNHSPLHMTINAKSVSLYAFPSLIFLMHHAIAFPALQYLDPVSEGARSEAKGCFTEELLCLTLKTTPPVLEAPPASCW